MNYDDVRKAQKGLKLLENKVFYFYGANGTKFKLDDLVFEALEDPNDGYRSSLGAVVLRNDTGIFHKRPLGEVVMEYIEKNSVSLHILRDVDTNHIWLEIGTESYDDYYPCFVFRYKPDTTQTNYVEVDKDYQPFLNRYPELLLKVPEWFNQDLKIEFTEY